MTLIEHPCEDCDGTGSVRVHSPEDYGVSFECEGCETCGGTGVDVPVLQADYRGAVEALREFQEGLTGALNDHGVPAMPSWREAIDWLAAHGGQ